MTAHALDCEACGAPENDPAHRLNSGCFTHAYAAPPDDFDAITYDDLVRLVGDAEPEEEVGTFVMSPRVAEQMGCAVAAMFRALKLASKRRRRVRTRGHGGRRR